MQVRRLALRLLFVISYLRAYVVCMWGLRVNTHWHYMWICLLYNSGGLSQND